MALNALCWRLVRPCPALNWGPYCLKMSASSRAGGGYFFDVEQQFLYAGAVIVRPYDVGRLVNVLMI